MRKAIPIGGLVAKCYHVLIEERREAFDYIIVETTGLADPSFAKIRKEVLEKARANIRAKAT